MGKGFKDSPVPVVEVEHETTMLGGAANVVNNIVSLGGNVLLSGVLGFANPQAQDIIADLVQA